MLLVIGTEHCAKCKMTKSILDKNEIKYTYKLNNEISKEEFNKYINEARVKGLMSFPLIINNDEIITLKDIVE